MNFTNNRLTSLRIFKWKAYFEKLFTSRAVQVLHLFEGGLGILVGQELDASGWYGKVYKFSSWEHILKSFLEGSLGVLVGQGGQGCEDSQGGLFGSGGQGELSK